MRIYEILPYKRPNDYNGIPCGYTMTNDIDPSENI